MNVKNLYEMKQKFNELLGGKNVRKVPENDTKSFVKKYKTRPGEKVKRLGLRSANIARQNIQPSNKLRPPQFPAEPELYFKPLTESFT